MHPLILERFEALISLEFKGGSVLEIGAMPDSSTLLAMKSLRATEKIGVNLFESGKCDDFEVIKANANDLSMFSDDHFDLVMSNATLEHDKYFWKTLSEINRIIKAEGLLAIGVPGYKRIGLTEKVYKSRFVPDSIKFSTPTFVVHDVDKVGDFYRFSEQCVREIMFEGFTDVAIETLLMPPRIIGIGFKKRM